jgi:cell division protein ZapA
MDEPHTITVSILDKDYQVTCPPDEVTALRESAQYLDDKMREMKESTSVFGLDRLAVMAALNIANDYISQTHKTLGVVSDHKNDIQALNGKLETALDRLRAIG